MNAIARKPAPILLVEDNDQRVVWFQEHLPDGFRLVHSSSAGRAVGTIRRDAGHVYAAVLLDHDLQDHAATEADRSLTGGHVVAAVIEHIDSAVPVLVHSANVDKAPDMVARLEASGFDVERMPFGELRGKAAWFGAWLEEAREIWEDEQGWE